MDRPTEVPTAAEVTIILPVFNDGDWVGAAIESCLAQTLQAIEVLVIDDGSVDGTAAIAEHYASIDTRVRIIRQGANQSAFQARRRGIESARAPFVLFLDGDDELMPKAAETTLALARSEDADVVAFGSQVVKPNGTTGGNYEASMQPRHPELLGEDILRNLFPIGKTAQGQLWRYLFDRKLLVEAYASLPATLILPRVNDLPIAFLALMQARKYVSVPTIFYKYFFRRGASGHELATLEDYYFMASAIDSIEAIANAVQARSVRISDGDALAAIYESTRLSVVGRVLEYVSDIVDNDLRVQGLDLLTKRVGRQALIAACADFAPRALPMLASTDKPAELNAVPPKHIIVRTGNLGTGGVQGVVVAQARHLQRAGFTVTILTDQKPDTLYSLPDSVKVAQVLGSSRAQRIGWLLDFCRRESVDVVIDHHILYNDRWPLVALAMSEAGIPMLGWLHNFALRPVLDGNDKLSFLSAYLRNLTSVIVLSEADVAYWKMRGIQNVAYLPNPPSPVLEHFPVRSEPRPAPSNPLEIVWWGRLQQSTKQVRELVEIGGALRDANIDFKMTVIGPDGPDLTAKDLLLLADARGISKHFTASGALHGQELREAIEHAHVFVSTSAIEGYPLALVEAQAAGLPIVMYELPWLAIMTNNAGVVSVAQGDRRAAARSLASLFDPVTYDFLATGALEAARETLSHHFTALYSDLVHGRLDPQYSPEPTIHEARLLLAQHVLFTERLIRREARSLGRARKDAENSRKKAARLSRELAESQNQTNAVRGHTTALPGIPAPPPPSVPRSGWKGWLQRVLPATMKQSGYYARHHHSLAVRHHREIATSLVNVHARLDSQLSAMDEILKTQIKLYSRVERLESPLIVGNDE